MHLCFVIDPDKSDVNDVIFFLFFAYNFGQISMKNHKRNHKIHAKKQPKVNQFEIGRFREIL